jgi:peroxiredoxin Q/BCP
MAKKKAAKRKMKRAKTVRKVLKKKATRAAARRPKKKAVRKGVTKAKAARKKRVKKTVKKVVRRPAKRAIPVKPKRARRVKQALPPKAPVAPPPIVESERRESAFPPGPFVTPPAPAERIAPAPPPMPNVGEVAPDFALPDETGRMHSLAQYRGKKIVLYFYPKDDTPGCTTEACGLRDKLGQFTDRNAVVLGVSPDSVESHQRFSQKYGLTFPLLADEGQRVAQQYGVWVERERFGEMTMGIARTTFLIDEGGRIAHVFRNVRPEGHEQEILQYL